MAPIGYSPARLRDFIGIIRKIMSLHAPIQQMEMTQPPLGKPDPVSRIPCTDVRSVALTGLFTLATLWFLHEAAMLAIPLTLAVLLHFLLSPVVRTMKRYRIPEPVSAAIVLLALASGIAITGIQLAEPAAEWLGKAPQALRTIESKLQPVKSQVSQATEAIEQAAHTGSGDSVSRVQVQSDWQAPVFNVTKQVLGTIGTALLLLYFLLASGDLFIGKLMGVLGRQEDRDRAVCIVGGVEKEMSHYLFETILVQSGMGVALWIALAWLGMPNPGLWAMTAAILQIIPYIGTLVVLVMIAIVATVSFNGFWPVAGPILAYVGLTTLKGYLSLILLGHRLVMNPVVVLMSLILFDWMWGLPGALLAVPLLASFKILCDHIDRLRPVGEFLAG